MIEQVLNGLMAALSWESVLAMVVGTMIGIMIGALPGLSGSTGIALCLPFTYGLDPLAALGLLAGIHNGSSQGGAIPAILLRIPGTPGAIVTSWDGYPRALQGQAGSAIKLAAYSSAVGGMLSAVALMLLAPPLATWALAFGPPEIFWVHMFGLASVTSLLGRDLVKGVLSTSFGLLIACIGISIVTGEERLTFGMIGLLNGIPSTIFMIGFFALPPIWEMAYDAIKSSFSKVTAIEIKSTKDFWQARNLWGTWLRSSAIGIVMGILPGSQVSSLISYSVAKNASKTPDEFGKGSAEGLAAAESVNNADNAAAMIPALTLGIPGSNVAALMLGALLIHGFQPGARLFREAPNIVFGYTWQMFITSALLLVLGGIAASRVFGLVLRVPQALLVGILVALTVAGAFSLQNYIFDVYLVLICGLVGFGFALAKFPVAPAVIGMVLGPSAEANFGISLLLSEGDYSVFFTRPLCIILILLTIIVFVSPMIRPTIGYFRARRTGSTG